MARHTNHIAAAFCACLLFTGEALAAKITKPVAVIELFTSQGCYSCPPADELVGEFSRDDTVLAISRHVTYWDYLGWKDSFGMKANTERQYAYARMLRERQVYTPQAVINGQAHAVGSRKDKILEVVEKVSAGKNGLVVPVDVTVGSDSVNIQVANMAEAEDATLYIMSMKSSQTVEIPKGENAGKTLTYYNVLHDVQALGMVKASGLNVQFPISELKQNGYDCYALVLQTKDKNGNPAAIIGAAFIEDL